MKTDFYSRIGSVTKTFTVTGVLQLADKASSARRSDREVHRRRAAGRQDHAAPTRPDAERAVQLLRVTGVPAGDVRRPAPNLHSAGIARLRVRRSRSVPARRGIRVLATPTRSCSAWWWRRSADNRCRTTSRPHPGSVGDEHTSFPTTNAFPDPHAQGYTVQTADGKEPSPPTGTRPGDGRPGR